MHTGTPGDSAAVLERLYTTILARKGTSPEESYTASLFADGARRIVRKVGEEAIEVAIEGLRGDRPALARESADLLYHLLVLWADCGLRPEEVLEELARREGVSGLAEKAARGPKG